MCNHRFIVSVCVCRCVMEKDDKTLHKTSIRKITTTSCLSISKEDCNIWRNLLIPIHLNSSCWLPQDSIEVSNWQFAIIIFRSITWAVNAIWLTILELIGWWHHKREHRPKTSEYPKLWMTVDSILLVYIYSPRLHLLNKNYKFKTVL